MITQSKDIVLVTATDGTAGMYHNNTLVVEGRSDMNVPEVVAALRLPVDGDYSVGYVPFGRTFPQGFPSTYGEVFGVTSTSTSTSTPLPTKTALVAVEVTPAPPSLEERLAKVKFVVPGLAKAQAALGVISRGAEEAIVDVHGSDMEDVVEEEHPAYEDANGMPVIGEMIYVEGFNGVFADVEAGLSKIVNVYTLEHSAGQHAIVEKDGVIKLHVIDADEDEDENEDGVEDYLEEQNDDIHYAYQLGVRTKAVDIYAEVFVEVEDLPGNLLNWKMLREEQEELQERFANSVLRITANYSNQTK